MYDVECIPLKYNDTLDKDQIRLVKAAVMDTDNKVYTGWRHWQILHHMKSIGCERRNTTDDQGFVDQYGNYYRRIVCSSIALVNGQLKDYKSPLLSEYLWGENGEKLSD